MPTLPPFGEIFSKIFSWLLAYSILSYALQTMPESENRWVRWFFGVLNFALANIEQARSLIGKPRMLPLNTPGVRTSILQINQQGEPMESMPATAPVTGEKQP